MHIRKYSAFSVLASARAMRRDTGHGGSYASSIRAGSESSAHSFLISASISLHGHTFTLKRQALPHAPADAIAAVAAGDAKPKSAQYSGGLMVTPRLLQAVSTLALG